MCTNVKFQNRPTLFKMAIKEALVGDAAVAAQSVTMDSCLDCGQADHYARDCPQGSAQPGRGGARPQGLIEDEADNSPEGAPAAQTDEIGARWCAIGA